MFWIIFIILIFGMGVIGIIVDIFEQMKDSEYEIVRIAYWVGVIAVFALLFSWLSSC